MQEEKVEGIVLRSFDYRESKRIVTLFTKEKGILSLIVSGIRGPKLQMRNLTTPLCRGEFIYQKGKSDLYKLVDGSILDLHLELRKNINRLKEVGKCLQIILETQLPEKPSFAFYQLFQSYLKQFSRFPLPEILTLSFHLKFLKHEGFFSEEKLKEFSKKDQAIALQLANAKKFEELERLEPSEKQKAQIYAFFKKSLFQSSI